MTVGQLVERLKRFQRLYGDDMPVLVEEIVGSRYPLVEQKNAHAVYVLKGKNGRYRMVSGLTLDSEAVKAVMLTSEVPSAEY